MKYETIYMVSQDSLDTGGLTISNDEAGSWLYVYVRRDGKPDAQSPAVAAHLLSSLLLPSSLPSPQLTSVKLAANLRLMVTTLNRLDFALFRCEPAFTRGHVGCRAV
jgi:hypothetical protein